jgi:hypothetical protein
MKCQVRVGIWSEVQEVAVRKTAPWQRVSMSFHDQPFSDFSSYVFNGGNNFNSTKSSTNIKIKHRHCGASMAMFEMFLVPFYPCGWVACQ